MGNGRGRAVSIAPYQEWMYIDSISVLEDEKEFSDITKIKPNKVSILRFSTGLSSLGINITADEEVLKYLADRSFRDTVIREKMEDTLGEINDAFTRLALAVPIKFVNKFHISEKSEDMTYTGMYTHNSKVITYPMRVDTYKDPSVDFMMNLYATRQARKTQWHPVDGGVKSTISHEYGHAINDYFDHAFYTTQAGAAFKKFTEEVKEAKTPFQAVSQYGSYNHREAFAEAFSAYVSGVKVRPQGRAYMAHFETLMSEAGFSGFKNSVRVEGMYHVSNSIGKKLYEGKIKRYNITKFDAPQYNYRRRYNITKLPNTRGDGGFDVVLKIGRFTKRFSIRGIDRMWGYKRITVGGVSYTYDIDSGILQRMSSPKAPLLFMYEGKGDIKAPDFSIGNKRWDGEKWNG